MREWHFRHEAGEGCAEYFAVLAEEMICRGVGRAILGEGPYLLDIRRLPTLDLAVTRKIVRKTEVDGRRVDVALYSEKGSLNVVIARREADQSIPCGATGLWLVLDVTDCDEGRVLELENGITFNPHWMFEQGFPRPKPKASPIGLRQAAAPTSTGLFSRGSPTHRIFYPRYDTLSFGQGLSDSNSDDPDKRRPSETREDHLRRLHAKYPWMSRKP
ncbi:hypothetical protein GKC28_13780 [Leisingera sp. ANG59]|nr:hypothetical protein [Leisingera sp. ANG59]